MLYSFVLIQRQLYSSTQHYAMPRAREGKKQTLLLSIYKLKTKWKNILVKSDPLKSFQIICSEKFSVKVE